VSSREDHGRYRGRRRAPTPPRSRYAAVVTSAFLGAGVVALGTAAAFPGNSAADPAALTAASANGAVTSTDLSDRQATLDRATRGDNRTDASATNAAATLDQVAPEVWLLPLKNYTVSSPFGIRWGVIHPGVDLAIAEGTPYVAAHSGTVILARFEGGYGYVIEIDCGNGTTVVYGHSSALFVHEGQKVEAGQVIGLTGNTGYSTGPHLHLEIRQNGQAINPVPYLLGKGVDIAGKTDALTS
jgi:murein DD-endopeptidase MepM/ murein hydrolase activator NlpD